MALIARILVACLLLCSHATQGVEGGNRHAQEGLDIVHLWIPKYSIISIASGLTIYILAIPRDLINQPHPTDSTFMAPHAA